MERLRLYTMSVIFTNKEMEFMEEILSSFLVENGVKLSVPVDVFALADSLGFDVRGAEFRDKLEGILLVNELQEKIEGFDSNKVIGYNCFKDINTKKFIVAHELAHYIEEKQANKETHIVIAARDHEDGYSDNKDEQRKDYIAAAILVPKDDLLSRYKKEEISNDDVFYAKVAEAYNVDLELAKRRVQEVIYGER